MTAAPIGAAIAASGMLAAIVADALPDTPPSVWTIVLALASAFTLFRAGSVRAWKETAEAREERIRDLAHELAHVRGELEGVRQELAIPERIEGIVALMADTASRADARATERLEGALVEIRGRFDGLEAILLEHNS